MLETKKIYFVVKNEKHLNSSQILVKKTSSNNSRISAIEIEKSSIPFTENIVETELNSIDPNESFIPDDQIIKQSERTFPFEFLASKSEFLLNESHLKKVDYLKIPKSNKWAFGLLFGNFVNNKKLLAGATIGGKATYNINRKFKIGGGLQYIVMTGYKKGEKFRQKSG